MNDEVMHHLDSHKSAGFTVIELLVAMTIGMVMLAGVTTTFMLQAKTYNAQQQINEMEQNARGVLDVVMRDLKMAGYKPNGGAFNGVTYNTTQLLIQADLDASGDISTSSTVNEQITYAYDTTNQQITRAVGAGSALALADHITAFSFTYLDSAGASTTTSTNIRQVAISITAQTGSPDPNYTSNGGYRTYTVAATVAPLNLAL